MTMIDATTNTKAKLRMSSPPKFVTPEGSIVNEKGDVVVLPSNVDLKIPKDRTATNSTLVATGVVAGGIAVMNADTIAAGVNAAASAVGPHAADAEDGILRVCPGGVYKCVGVTLHSHNHTCEAA